MAVVVREAEPLSRHTVFRIGGPARYFIEAADSYDVVAAIRVAEDRGLPWLMLGAGSNVLALDSGFPGVVIHRTGGSVAVSGNRVTVDASLPMAHVVADSLQSGLRGFEWAIGVPGSIGGSIVGNAGCFGGEMKDVVLSATIYDATRGRVETWSRDALEFSYRESALKRRPEVAVLDVTLGLKPGDAKAGSELVRQHTLLRVKSQDIGSQCAGCIFKNTPWDRRDIRKDALLSRFPELLPFRSSPGIPSGFLIDQLGLKGRRIGGAEISRRHGNFIVNTGGATAEDVLMLTSLAKEYAHRHYGVLLEEEIRYVGFEDYVNARESPWEREAA